MKNIATDFASFACKLTLQLSIIKAVDIFYENRSVKK